MALKFLPEGVDRDQPRLARFLNEVRTARQVTHPNVCRVFDIAEVDGQPYLSMEYVDGEDLSSLLRRIGYLPKDKALQIARQLCAGVQAAHEQGILHRDLKPANVMIDGRGRVKITDFGLAHLADQGTEIRSGTPAYMAPEQLTGQDVTVRSDIYALGLVLYELFTGKPAFEAATLAERARLQRDSTLANPSSHVEGFDPGVERIILRCLEEEPRDRPASALAVSAALPGGDPLAAALAAGETPSPEMVAAAGEGQGLHPGVALACLSVMIVGLVGFAMFPTDNRLFSQIGLEKPLQVLAAEARGLLEALGHDEPGLDRAYAFALDRDYLSYVEREKTPEERWRNLSTIQPPPVHFWYRESPRYLAPVEGVGGVTPFNPPVQVSGMANVRLDAHGHLLELLVVPPQVDDGEPPWPEPDWGPLLKTAGFLPDALTPVPPVWNALVDVDRRAAWEGTYPGQDAIPVRVEAAAYHGNPVFFHVVLPWTRPTRMEEAPSETGDTIANTIQLVLFGAVLIGGFLLARRNLRRGRGDRKGALRLSVFVFCGVVLVWVFGNWHPVPSWSQPLWFVRTVSEGLFLSVAVGMTYLAVEPYARRLWPELLISWGRLLEGRFRHPRIGRDILIGGLAAILGVPVFSLLLRSPIFANPNLLTGPGMVAGLLQIAVPLGSVLLLTLLLFFLILLRRQWITVMMLFLVLTVVGGAATGGGAIGWLAIAWQVAVILFVLVRFGLLAMIFLNVFANGLTSLPIGLDPSAWYAGYSVVSLLALIALAVYGFSISLAGRRVFSETLLDGEAGGLS